MNLQHLCATSHVSIYFDSWNNWLFLDWSGDLTLPNVQQACLAVAHCFLDHTYARILNSNVQVTNLAWDITPWLARHLFPYMSLAGVERLAWVHSPALRGLDMAEEVLKQHPDGLEIALFSDVEQAVSWLQQTSPEYYSGCALLPRPAAISAKLLWAVQNLSDQLSGVAIPEQPLG